LSLAHCLELLGARVLNPYHACLKLKDKIVTAGLLFQENIPTPNSYAAGDTTQLRQLLDQGALILKLNRGYHGVGLSVIKNTDNLYQAQHYPQIKNLHFQIV
jgi:glutathione synthase/RimK-type ligase-like ATP-grasp enzyme